MKLTNAAVIIALGFLVLYLTMTGKIDLFAAAFRQAFLPGTQSAAQSRSTTQPYGGPTYPPSSPYGFRLPGFGGSV